MSHLKKHEKTLKHLLGEQRADDDDGMCDDDPLLHGVFAYYIMLGCAVLFVFYFSFRRKRENRICKTKCNECNDRPGLVYPMDIFTKSNKLTYACAFGATVNLLFKCIFDQFYIIDDTNLKYPFLDMLFALISMFAFGLIYFPMFACLSMRKMLDVIAGAFYILGLTAVQLMQMIYWKRPSCNLTALGILKILENLPGLICLLYILGITLWKIKKYWKPIKTESLDDLKKSSVGKYVMRFFKKEKPDKPNKCIQVIHDTIYSPDPRFFYSARILTTHSVGFILLYLMAIQIYWGIYRLHGIMQNDLIPFLHKSHYLSDDDVENIQKGIPWIIATMTVTTTVAFVFCLISIFLMLKTYRRNMISIHKGKLKMEIPEKSSQSIVAGAIRYSGFQVISVVWGFLVQDLILFVSIVLFFGGVWMYSERDITRSVFFVGKIVVVLIVVKILECILQWVAKYFILENRQDLVLTNRKCMHVHAYFEFFYNMFTGILTSLVRIGKSLVFSSILVPRLDHNVLPRVFADWDSGYTDYISFIKLENSQKNPPPIALAFVRLLIIMRNERVSAESNVHETSNLLQPSTTTSFVDIGRTSFVFSDRTRREIILSAMAKRLYIKGFAKRYPPGFEATGSTDEKQKMGCLARFIKKCLECCCCCCCKAVEIDDAHGDNDGGVNGGTGGSNNTENNSGAGDGNNTGNNSGAGGSNNAENNSGAGGSNNTENNSGAVGGNNDDEDSGCTDKNSCDVTYVNVDIGDDNDDIIITDGGNVDSTSIGSCGSVSGEEGAISISFVNGNNNGRVVPRSNSIDDGVDTADAAF